MLTVTPEFKTAMRANIKDTVRGFITLSDETVIRGWDEGGEVGPLQKIVITSTGAMLKTAMSKISLTISGDHENMVGEVIEASYGTYFDDDWHYVMRGKFKVTDAVYKKDKGSTEITGFDRMLEFQRDYTPIGEYPMTLYQYLVTICSLAGVALENDTIYNGSLSIPEDYYATISEYTIRDVLEDVCEAAASYALINANGNLELRQLQDSGEVLTYKDMIKYEVGDMWGRVNSLVLSRQPQNDDVFVRDDNDIRRPTTRNILDLRKFSVGYSMEES